MSDLNDFIEKMKQAERRIDKLSVDGVHMHIRLHGDAFLVRATKGAGNVNRAVSFAEVGAGVPNLLLLTVEQAHRDLVGK